MQSNLMMQLPVEKAEQQLAGFLIESMEGIAIHSHGKDADHLCLIHNSSTEPELQAFINAWQLYRAGLEMTDCHDTPISGVVLLPGSQDQGDTQHV
jgi:hypothetical protein